MGLFIFLIRYVFISLYFFCSGFIAMVVSFLISSWMGSPVTPIRIVIRGTVAGSVISFYTFLAFAPNYKGSGVISCVSTYFIFGSPFFYMFYSIDNYGVTI